MLISGGLILTLINIHPHLNQIKFAFLPLQINGIGLFIFIISSGLGSLTLGFILHLILRALWLTKMGIASSFKEPLNPNEFGFSSFYKNRIVNIDIQYEALKLGRISSLIFSVSFFMLLIFIGFSILSIVFAILVGLSSYIGLDDFLGPIMLGLLLLLFIDFISLGRFKRTKIGILLYPVFAVLYFLSLSFLYRDIYYHLVQNIKKRTLIFGFVAFIASSIFIGWINASVFHWEETMLKYRYDQYSPNIYDDERKPLSGRDASISSYYQSKDIVKLFLLGHYDKIETALDNNDLSIKINNEVVKPSKILNHTTDEMQFGYLYFLNISHLSPGIEYEIEIVIENQPFIIIPFYKE